MIDRATVIDENFSRYITEDKLPAITQHHYDSANELTKKQLLSLFNSQIISRHLDLQARRLKDKNLGFYTIGSSGHEANAAVAEAFSVSDPAFLHYRSGAFMVHRATQKPGQDIIKDILLSLMAAKDDPIASGRHKVFGSVSLNVPPQTSTIASHLPKAVGAALSITRAKELSIDSSYAEDSVVLCSFGDASVNHSVAQGAFNTAQWIVRDHYPLPLVFICEDNGLGISVPTPADWVATTMQARPGIHYIAANGLNIIETYHAAKQAEAIARIKKQPVFLHLKMVRLMGHAGSDVESLYLSQQDIEANEAQDPLLHTAAILLQDKVLSPKEILKRYENVRQVIAEKAEMLQQAKPLDSAKAVMASIKESKYKPSLPPYPSDKQRQDLFEDQLKQLSMPRNMAQQINLALHNILLQYPNALVFGEDVAKKGGVYHVTANLQRQFGPRRVFDTLLDETSILGTAIGLAHNGFIPIPEIQFLAYLHNAEDQLRGEAATLSFFSNGQFSNPMVLRIASLAYQKGFGGHFHNDNSIAVLRDIPGLIIACPSNGADAAKMLRTCVAKAHAERRICVFLEPIALYMTKDLLEPGDNLWLSNYPEPEESIAVGDIGVYGDNSETVIISYGNGYYLSRQAAAIVEQQHQYKPKVIDLRWLAPLNEAAILEQVKSAKQVIIVDECRRTGSISEALVTLMVEHLKHLPKIKRITAEDSFIPLGNAWQHILPSTEKIIAAIEES